MRMPLYLRARAASAALGYLGRFSCPSLSRLLSKVREVTANSMDPEALIYGVIAAKVRTAPGEKGMYTPYHISVFPGADHAVVISFINSDGSMEETRRFVLPAARRVSMKTSGKADYIVAVEVASIRIKLKLSSRDSQLKWVRLLEPPPRATTADRTSTRYVCR